MGTRTRRTRTRRRRLRRRRRAPSRAAALGVSRAATDAHWTAIRECDAHSGHGVDRDIRGTWRCGTADAHGTSPTYGIGVRAHWTAIYAGVCGGREDEAVLEEK